MPNGYEDMEQESRLYPWIDDPGQEWDVEIEDEDWNADLYYDTMDDGQPSEYDEWQDYFPLMGGDDGDHGQYDNGEW